MAFLLAAIGAMPQGTPALATQERTTPLAGQTDLGNSRTTDPTELPEGYRQWLDEQVVWIITRKEREVFGRLRSDAQRDLFIENFWKARDPSPATARNEYREQHYDRIAYANRALGGETPKPGSLTDRGRVWVLLGEPRSRNELSGGVLQPSELWFYSVDPALGLPPHFSLIFFRDVAFGEYRLWSPSTDGPEKLLTLAARASLGNGDLATRAEGLKMGATTAARAVALVTIKRADPMLADAAVSLVPGGKNDRVGRGDMLLSRVMDVGEALMPDPAWLDRLLAGETRSEVRFETLPLAAEAILFGSDVDAAPELHLGVRIDGSRLEILRSGGRSHVGFELATTFRGPDDEPLRLTTPRVIDAPLDAEQAALVGDRDFQYLWLADVPAGARAVELELASVVTREFGRVRVDLDDTAPDGAGLAAYRPFLLREIRNLAGAPPPVALPFQLGELLLVPALDGPFVEGGTVGVFWQVRVAHRPVPAVAARFRLVNEAGEQAGEWVTRIDVSRAGRGGLVNHLARVSLAGLPSGRYRLECTLITEGGAAGRTVSLPLRVAATGGAPILYFEPSAPPEVAR